ncbi:BamA/TamA family outer membrane protein [Rubinisphaera sp.]|uniref:BamA/OMP85 family outer membrane protein n=1 Tax=Rubinisphaera sp. TaxID=2024857 RepID=UPI000C0F0707|nr:BamA/TamA family outer membrane protein [Rubinisphaera sp.]MBV10041.1 hypothetical protein [Rubinisphaera sp.]
MIQISWSSTEHSRKSQMRLVLGVSPPYRIDQVILSSGATIFMGRSRTWFSLFLIAVVMSTGCAGPLSVPVAISEEEPIIRGQSPDNVDPAFANAFSSPSQTASAPSRQPRLEASPARSDELTQEMVRPTSYNSLPPITQTSAVQPKRGEDIVDVQIEGATTIPVAAMSGYIKTRPGRPVTEDQVRDDVRSLYNTKWFFSISPVYRRTDAGLVLVFKVAERPILRSVEYVGNENIKEKELAGITGLKPLHAFSVATNREAARRIHEFYKQKGYLFAEVALQTGESPDDRSVVFAIKEGPKVKVATVRFEGNQEVSSELLKLRLNTKKRFLWYFGGQYDPTTIPEDVVAVKKYYHNIGYFDVQVVDSIEFSADQSLVTVTYKIEEGPRYKIRSLLVDGNQIYSREELLGEFEVLEGEYFSARDLAKDVAGVQDKYGQLGRLFAKVNTETVFTKEPGVVDLKLTIDEDRVYKIGMVNVHIRGNHSHTKETVALNQLLLAPGDLADPEKIRKSRARFAGAATWEAGGPEAPEINIRPVANPTYLAQDAPKDTNIYRGSDEYFGKAFPADLLPQSAPVTEFVPTTLRTEANPPGKAHVTSPIPGGGHTLKPVEAIPETRYYREERTQRPDTDELLLYQPLDPENDAVFFEETEPFLTSSVPIMDANGEQAVVRAQNYDNYNAPPNMIYSQTPQGDLLGPQFQTPQLPPGYVDLDVYLSEARTGRFMVGAGVNSDSGVVGNIVLEEQNFDIGRFPTSFRDVVDGYAFRGGGQQFRLEATPGSQVSRYLASWTDPYFLDTDYSLGVSGFFYERFFRDYNETRLGGRVNVGKLLTKELSFNTALRLEKVDINNPRLPVGLAPSIDEVVGSNFLATGRGTIAYDTRDSTYLATEGFNLSTSVEQAFADFDFTKVDLQGSQYFTTYQRPDGGGKHVLSFRGNVGYTTDGTPTFERYFAGGFQTFRGFEFRSVTPLEPDNIGTNGAAVGGYFQTLGTVEYMLPVMANEALRVVAFSDFGTVDNAVSLEEFRVSVGAGLRITVPQMGPVPIALDWAFPVVKQETDIRQIFSFYIGLTR